MSDMTVSMGVPEVQIGTGTLTSPSTPATFSGAWGDMAKDMAALEKETGIPAMTPAQPEDSQPSQAVVTPTATPVTTPAAQTAPQTPVATIAAPAAVVPAVEVPEKFRGADGKLDQEKLLKSYSEAEKALGRANSAKSQPAPQTPGIPAQVAQPQVPGNLTPLELQVARDLYNGGGYTEQAAISTARVQVRLMEAARGSAVESAMGEVAQLREAQMEQRRSAELQSLAKNYPDVLTPKGFEELTKVREENPWLNASPEPWKAAAQILVGQKGMMQGQAGTVVIPTPTGAQQQPLPVTPSAPVSNPLQLNTPQQIEAHVKTLTPAQEAEFWTKAGMKWDVPRAAFKGF